MRGTRLPEDWKPTADDWNYAAKLGLDVSVIDRIVEDFRDFWISCPGQKGLKLRWDLTWHTWVRREADKRGHGRYVAVRDHRDTAIEIANSLAMNLGLEAAK